MNAQQMTSNFKDVTDFPWFECRLQAIGWYIS